MAAPSVGAPAGAMALETRRAPWWLGLMSGILTVIVGILLLTSPVRTAVSLVWWLGLYWFTQGIFTLMFMFVDHSSWGWKLISGLLGIAAGLLVMDAPIANAIAIPSFLILLLGLQGIVGGAISLVHAFKGGGLVSAIGGLISIALGIFLAVNAYAMGAALSFFWMMAVLAIVGGIVQIFQAFRQRAA